MLELIDNLTNLKQQSQKSPSPDNNTYTLSFNKFDPLITILYQMSTYQN